MPSLAKLQETFLKDIYTGSSESLAYLDESIPDVAGRLNIYKNNTRLNLIETLKNIYPVTCQIVGDEFFKTMARHFIKQSPLVSGNSNDYGAGFDAFIKSFEEAKSLPYLSDMAKLEYAYFRVGLEVAEEPLTQELLQASLEQDGDVNIALNSHVKVIELNFNVHDLWQLHQNDNSDFSSFELTDVAVSLLIARDASHMTWMKVLDADTAVFLMDIQAGKSFAESMQNAMEKGGDMEALQMSFGHLLNGGYFIKLNGEKQI